MDKGMILPGPPIYQKSGSKGSIRKSKLERGGLWISQSFTPVFPGGRKHILSSKQLSAIRRSTLKMANFYSHSHPPAPLLELIPYFTLGLAPLPMPSRSFSLEIWVWFALSHCSSISSFTIRAEDSKPCLRDGWKQSICSTSLVRQQRRNPTLHSYA